MRNALFNIVNADLANDLGNLLNRTLKMALKYFEGSLSGIDPKRNFC